MPFHPRALLALLLLAVPAAGQDSARVAAVTAGQFFACALDAEGRAYCWGFDAEGQLGAGAEGVERREQCEAGLDRVPQPCSRTPLPVAGGLRFRAIDAGEHHACALTRAGEAYCWGKGPFDVLGVPRLSETCAALRLSDRQLHSRPCSRSPVRVATAARFTSISAGEDFTCALTAGGEAWCWGGYWGTDHSSNPGPRRIGRTLRFRAVAAEGRRACGATTAGSVWCWDSWKPTPERVPAPVALASAVPSPVHACGLTTAGRAYCWGENTMGQLGTGDASMTDEEHPPRPVAGGLRFRSIHPNSGGGGTCALDIDGALWCWGASVESEESCPGVGRYGICAVRPERVGTRTFRSFGTGVGFACGVTREGDAVCWGGDWSGVVPSETQVSADAPVRITLPAPDR